MEKFTKNTLKAAVKVYGPLHTEGKTEEEVKAAISADEKGFTDDQVNEIYAAIADDSDKETLYKVISQFRDKDDFSKLYEIGDDVSHFDEARKADLIDRKLIEAI